MISYPHQSFDRTIAFVNIQHNLVCRRIELNLKILHPNLILPPLQPESDQTVKSLPTLNCLFTSYLSKLLGVVFRTTKLNADFEIQFIGCAEFIFLFFETNCIECSKLGIL